MLLVLVGALQAWAQVPELNKGKLRVTRAGKGQIDLTSGMATFSLKGWQLLPATGSDGIEPGTEPVSIGIAEEKFIIPAGQLKVSRRGTRFRYAAHDDRGVQRLTLVRLGDGSFKVSLRIAGVDLSTLIVTDPPACLPFAVIVGNDDGFTGVSFDRPKPFPSKLLTIPGFCDSTTNWPWA